MSTAVAEKPAADTVRIFEVRVMDEEGRTNEEFNGVRQRVRFTQGKAQLPEPRAADFDHLSDYKSEQEAFKTLIRGFVKDLGYKVTTREMQMGIVEPLRDSDYRLASK